MNWIGCRWKWSWSFLWHYPNNRLAELRKYHIIIDIPTQIRTGQLNTSEKRLIQLFDDSHLKSLRSVVTKRNKFFISYNSITLRLDTRVPPTVDSNCGCYYPLIRELEMASGGNSTTCV
jgi:hypothetical protein